MNVFCYQCEQTVEGTGCYLCGVCGKTEKVAHLQNLLTAWAKHIAQTATQMLQRGNSSEIIDSFFINALYSTLTNVNFNEKEITKLIFLADHILQLTEYLSTENNPEYQSSLEEQILQSNEEPTEDQIEELVGQGKAYSIATKQNEFGPTIAGLQELILCGLRGTAAYTFHSLELHKKFSDRSRLELKTLTESLKKTKARDSKEKEKKAALQSKINSVTSLLTEWGQKERHLLDGIITELAFLANESTDLNEYLDSALRVGFLNLEAMELLEKGHIQNFGIPEPSVVRLSPIQGKCILVSGHNLKDLYDVLVLTEGKNINVYTHGEMLPAHSYPLLKKFKHLAGHYGTAWQNQQREFDAFPGAILMTSNCLQQPSESYQDYIFTTGPVSWPGIKAIQRDSKGRKDYSPLIQAAFDSPGFFKSKGNEKITIGFGADAIINIWDQIQKAIQQKQLRRFFLIGGCDGSCSKRSYFTDLALAIPNDCVIITLGCGKFRFNREVFAPLPSGLPRLWDVGQCNDAYSAIRVVQFMSEQLNCEIKNLPISIFLSWFEQKAVAVLLTLLALNIKNIRLGPTLPAFLTPDVLNMLADRFGLNLISDPQTDLADCLKK
ncbi:MAG: hydroxylamine reductase [Planctomycetia bacterium]|nr:hydroxylamine reductase [Planctomycetia bacterium]